MHVDDRLEGTACVFLPVVFSLARRRRCCEQAEHPDDQERANEHVPEDGRPPAFYNYQACAFSSPKSGMMSEAIFHQPTHQVQDKISARCR